MKRILLTLFLLFTFFYGTAQISSTVEKYALDATVSESSGVIYYNGKIITHNDSGNTNQLFEMDPSSSTITRIVTISGATNIDWEDITQDADYIYIGDIGNNSGDRNNLKIYKISKTDYDTSDTVSTVEVINFSYANQSDFTSSPQATPWDAETLISIDANNLLIVSKNWVTHEAQTYVLSKTPGTYSLSPQASTLPDASGNYDLITGGTYNPLTNKVYLIGYTSNTGTFNALHPFIYECSGFSGTDIFSGTNTQYDISSSLATYEQTEGICYVDADTYYVTSESFSETYGPYSLSDYAKLIEVTTNDVALGIDDVAVQKVRLYPNPTTNSVQISSQNPVQVEVSNLQGQRLLQTRQHDIDLSAFQSGMYLFKITSEDNHVSIKKVLKN